MKSSWAGPWGRQCLLSPQAFHRSHHVAPCTKTRPATIGGQRLAYVPELFNPSELLGFGDGDEKKPQEILWAWGWRRRSLFGVCALPKGLSSGKAWARVYSPAACNSASRQRWRRQLPQVPSGNRGPQRTGVCASQPVRPNPDFSPRVWKGGARDEQRAGATISAGLKPRPSGCPQKRSSVVRKPASGVLCSPDHRVNGSPDQLVTGSSRRGRGPGSPGVSNERTKASTMWGSNCVPQQRCSSSLASWMLRPCL